MLNITWFASISEVADYGTTILRMRVLSNAGERTRNVNTLTLHEVVQKSRVY